MMSKKTLILSLLLFPSLFSLRVAAQERVTADKVVAVIGTRMVLYSDVVQTMGSMEAQRRQQGITSDRDPFCEALEQMVIQKVLYNQGLTDSIYVDHSRIYTMAEEALEQEIADKGSQAAVEKFYQKPLYEIRSDLVDRYEQVYYAYRMEDDVKEKVTITPGEVERYFRKLPKDSIPIVPEQYVYAQVTRYPPSQEDAKLRTRTRLLELRERIMKGENFSTLARIYSEDPGTAARGGEMEPVPKDAFVESFSNAMVKLSPGQVSEVVETEYGFHLIQMIEVTPNHLYRVRHILMQPQFTAQELETSFLLFDSLRTEIQAGKTTFEKVVLAHSEDKYSKNNQGVVSNLEEMEAHNYGVAKVASTRFFREDLSPEVYEVMKNMKPGEISEPFASRDLRGNLLCRMIRLNEIVPSHEATLAHDFVRIEEIALRQKKNEEYEKWLEKTMEGMFIRVNEEFRSCDFENQAILK